MHSFSLRQLYACLQDHLSTFRAAEGHSVNFRQLSVRPRDYLSNFMSAKHSVIFSKHSVPLRDLPLTCVNFRASAGHSINFPCIHGTFRQLPSTLSASAGPIFVCQWDIQSTFRSFVVPSVKFGQLSVYLRYLLSTFHASWGLWSTFRASARPSVNFCASTRSSINFQCGQGTIRQHFLQPWDLPSTSVNFPCLRGAFGQLSVRLCELPSTFRAAAGPFVNLCTFLGPSVTIPWDHGTFCSLQSNFCVVVGLSINFRQLSVRSWTFCQLSLCPHNLPSTSINFLSVRGTFRELF